MKKLILKIKSLWSREPKAHPRIEKINRFLNKYSLIFHALLACSLCFIVELISRRSFFSTCSFVTGHTMAFLYNSIIVFVSLSVAYLFRRRAFFRIIISGFWLILGTINGCILSNRVTPFGYTDLKCINDLLSMQDSNYFSATEATIIVTGLSLFGLFLVLFFLRGPKYQGKLHRFLAPVFVAALCFMLPVTTKAAQSVNVIASYFGNIAQGYEDYGFIYGFSSSVVGIGMNTPKSYSADVIEDILNEQDATETTVSEDDEPNIICVLLESFCDPYEVNYLNFSEDPIPNFHSMYDNYSSGHLTVPVVGAGTANTEFEILTGMSMQYFGTGEYPYKTVLKQTDCESIASDLSSIGYGTHVVHNNGGNFYSRANAFAQMGFDTFTSKEMMNITEYTPLGNWPTDHILVGETKKALDSTPDQSDFVYTITVQGHGSYPDYPVLENPEIQVNGAPTEAENYQWEYYVNEIHEVDKFIGDLTTMLSARDENTILVLFGDHLPTMDVTEENMATGNLYKTKYTTWNNYGLPKEDADLAAYQLLAEVTDQAGIHQGTMFTYTQSEKDNLNYLSGLELLQYDILYGNRYAYGGEDLYPATEIEMGVEDVTIDSTWLSTDGLYLCIRGNNYTPWSDVFINGNEVKSEFVSQHLMKVSLENFTLNDGDSIVVNQMGSRDTIFRSSNEFIWVAPEIETETETEILPEEGSDGTGITDETIAPLSEDTDAAELLQNELTASQTSGSENKSLNDIENSSTSSSKDTDTTSSDESSTLPETNASPDLGKLKTIVVGK